MQFDWHPEHAFLAQGRACPELAEGIWVSRALCRVLCDTITARLARFLTKLHRYSPPVLFGFRNKINFVARLTSIGEKLISTEGDQWIRRTARAAAVPDTLRGLWTSAVSPRALHLSG